MSDHCHTAGGYWDQSHYELLLSCNQEAEEHDEDGGSVHGGADSHAIAIEVVLERQGKTAACATSSECMGGRP